MRFLFWNLAKNCLRESVTHIVAEHDIDVVILNSAAAIWTVDSKSTLLDCAARAAEAIDSGAAQDLLARLIEVSNR